MPCPNAVPPRVVVSCPAKLRAPDATLRLLPPLVMATPWPLATFTLPPPRVIEICALAGVTEVAAIAARTAKLESRMERMTWFPSMTVRKFLLPGVDDRRAETYGRRLEPAVEQLTPQDLWLLWCSLLMSAVLDCESASKLDPTCDTGESIELACKIHV